MSKYTMYYNARQDMYRTFATNWTAFAKKADLNETQKKGMNLFFKPIARRFGLINEFKEIGVI